MTDMPFHRRLLPVVLAIALATGFATPAPGAQDAGEFIVDLNREAVAELNNETLTDGEKRERFDNMVLRSFDVPRMSKFVLGVNWRRATPEQREEFVTVFAKVNFERFLPLFTRYADQEFTVNRVRRDQDNPRLSFVNSTIKRGDSAPAAIEWRIIQTDDRYKVLDVKAEGVSMALTLRNEYGSVVKNHGVDGLIKQLRKKIKKDELTPLKSSAAK